MVMDWLTADKSAVVAKIEDVSKRCLGAYREQPSRVLEDSQREAAISYGAYRERQLFELVQNGADAMTEARVRGRIEIVLTKDALYCANEGAPIDADGADALMHSHVSRKRADQIGHFGLGFKSVLAVTSQPRFFSRSGSFEFDKQWAEARIRQVVPDAPGYPVLRMAKSLDPHQAAEGDRLLASLMTWAVTVVVLPVSEEAREQLQHAMEEFPPEFLLFAKSVASVTFQDDVGGARVTISTQSGEAGVTILDAETSRTRWRLFEGTAVVSDHALRELPPSPHVCPDERRRIPMVWAVSLDEARSQGRFWSFFPTNDESTLSGILNAGWKTNNDRYALLPGPLNEELLEHFARLVADALPKLVVKEDLGRHIDLLPARDAKSRADEDLCRFLYPELKRREILPDVHGALRLPSDLSLYPAGVPKEAVSYWSQAEELPSRWVHPHIETRERRPRAERLDASTNSWVSQWLEGAVSNPSEQNSRLAILAAAMMVKDARLDAGLRNARFVLTSTDELVPPNPEKVFVSADADSGCCLVHPQVAADPEVLAALRVLGIKDYGTDRRLQAKADLQDWEGFWALVEEMGRAADVIIRRLATAGDLCVRNLASEFVPFFEVLLRGSIVPGENGEDSTACIDDLFHADHLQVLVDCGLVAEPRRGGARIHEKRIAEYWYDVENMFRESILQKTGRTIRQGYIQVEPEESSGPLDPMAVLSRLALARYTDRLMTIAQSDRPWQARHSTNKEYGVETYSPPAVIAILRNGILETSCGIVPATDAVLQELEVWSNFLPVLGHTSETITAQKFPPALDDLRREDWEKAFGRILERPSIRLVPEFYAEAAARNVPLPRGVRCLRNKELDVASPGDVYASADELVVRGLEARGVPYLPCEDADVASRLIGWGFKAETNDGSRFMFVQAGPAIAASDRFPELGSRGANLELVPCSEISVETPTDDGLLRESHDLYRTERALYYRSDYDDAELLSHVLRIIPSDAAETRHPPSAVEELKRRVRERETVHEKLAELLGEALLRRRLPREILDRASSDGVRLDALALAHIAHAIHGASVLSVVSSELVTLGLAPPSRWVGSDRAIEFVRDLGFPPAYAGSSGAALAPFVDVPGPLVIPRLHDFQKNVEGNLRAFFREAEVSRGFVSLPTGAGKTRVVAEAIVGALREGELAGSILWIADREELCEQAVRTWMDVWRAFGSSDELRISRLWGSTNNKVRPVAGRPHLVVATYQTLSRRLTTDYDWLSSPSCIVVDEAHGSIAPSYTAILQWLGLDARRTPRPLIGLSATPFRGEDSEETSRLVARYGGRRFDHGVFPGDDAYAYLQNVGVLARVDHHLIESGVDIHLTAGELEHLRTFSVMPPSAEEKLGREEGRNNAILDEIEALPRGWPILVFALSVSHAELLASSLSLRGVSAMAISGKTPISARRHAIQTFKAGELQVLTNYGVLTTGFDAPGIRALFVTRPVFSPGLYQQMIGRGLRGPENGGEERCLIVNVEDNFEQYGEKLAFRHFEYLWSGANG